MGDVNLNFNLSSPINQTQKLITQHYNVTMGSAEDRPAPLRLGTVAPDFEAETTAGPIMGDKERKIALAYDMLDHQDATNVDSKGVAFTIRSVFVIDPKKTIRTILSYPASTGRNTAEVLRIVDSLQT